METEILDDNTYDKVRNVTYASFGARFGASLLDGLITMIPIIGLMYLGYANKSLVFLLLAVLLGLLYKPVMEGVWRATLGKMIVGITMVDSNLDQIDLAQSFKKNSIYIVSSVISLLTQFWVASTDAFKESEGFLEGFMANQGNPYEMVSGIWSLFILISCLSMLGSNLKQTLHDRFAQTYCVNNSTFE